MSFNYASLALIAENLIEKFGRTAQLLTPVKTGEQWSPSVTWDSSDIKIAQTKFTASERAGGLVQEGDKVFLVKGSESITNEQRIIDGVEFQIVDVTQIKPGNTSMLWRVHVRI